MGITIRGELDKENMFHDHYFPYIRGSNKVLKRRFILVKR